MLRNKKLYKIQLKIIMKPDMILIFDFGGQYCHLIARRIRDNNVYSEIVPCNTSVKKIEDLKEKLNIKGIILSGGPFSVYEKNSPKMDKEILELSIPILGLCYGHQLIAYYMKGKVKPAKKKEYGISFVFIDKAVDILKGLKKKEKVWMSHGDTVFSLPEDFEVIAHTENCPVAAFKHKHKPVYGVQWHPEVTHTESGNILLKNFIFDICKCKPNWNVGSIIDECVAEIKKVAGKNKVIVALSGGIDSSTATVLASRALGKNLTAVFVNHGFMREKEPQQIKKVFKKFNINLVFVDAKDRFLKRLKGVTDPEEKRKIIGEEFIRVFEDVAKKIKAEYLLQGTIYPDRIESGHSRKSDKIKSHHNVAGLPTKIKFKGIIEPLKDLYKDEVRELAKQLGLPKEIIQRQPFPGPGLAIRIIGEITEEKLKILKKADKIVTEEIEKSGLNKNLWQYFAVLLNTKTTGVKGDARAYGYTIAIRIVESREGMTANFARIPYDILENISTRITNEIPQVVRVVYDITNKPPSTIEWE
jgi:GMP synthase (glutamine-hydrolysing)